MSPIAIYTSDEYKNQTQTLFIRPNDNPVGLVVTIRWREFIKQWLMDISDETTGEVYATNIPLVASGKNIGFDLIGQHDYKRIGACFVASYTDELAGVDPKYGNLSKYELIWSDCLE